MPADRFFHPTDQAHYQVHSQHHTTNYTFTYFSTTCIWLNSEIKPRRCGFTLAFAPSATSLGIRLFSDFSTLLFFLPLEHKESQRRNEEMPEAQNCLHPPHCPASPSSTADLTDHRSPNTIESTAEQAKPTIEYASPDALTTHQAPEGA